MTQHTGPDPELVAAMRQAAGLTRAEAAELVYVTVHAWRSWESATGTARGRTMPRGLWELFCIKATVRARIEPNGE